MNSGLPLGSIVLLHNLQNFSPDGSEWINQTVVHTYFPSWQSIRLKILRKTCWPEFETFPYCINVSNDTSVAPKSSINDGSIEEETSSEEVAEENHEVQEEQLNIIYFTFWWSFFITLTCAAFFWVDLIPGFGTASSIGDLWDMQVYSTKASFYCSHGELSEKTVIANNYVVTSKMANNYSSLFQFRLRYHSQCMMI